MWLLGFSISVLCAYIAYRKRSLRFSGFFGAVIVGTLIIGGLNWQGFIVLAFFFISSSLFGKLSFKIHDVQLPTENTGGGFEQHSLSTASSVIEKGNERDIVQVFANGGVSAFAAFFYAITNDPLWVFVFVGALAAATADTWASEIGRFSRMTPRDCLSWKKVQPGLSGGVTVLGTISAWIGAFFTTLISIPLIHITDMTHRASISFWVLILLLSFIGWIGNWVDSLIGSRWQALYSCPVCGAQVEQHTHCHQRTTKIKGFKWMNNDWVNAIGTISAGILAGMTALWL